MVNTDDISPEVLNAMHILAAAMDGKKPEDGETSLYIDEEKEVIIYENHSSNRRVEANICGDSQRGAVIDFARFIITR